VALDSLAKPAAQLRAGCGTIVLDDRLDPAAHDIGDRSRIDVAPRRTTARSQGHGC
jgi:hypothetical protein